MALKLCGTCSTEKPKSAFNADSTKPDGLQALCRQCKSDRHRAVRYGLPKDEYRRMHDDQGGRCWICRKLPRARFALSVDHCHTTGRVRGLLCGPCNRALGIFDDDVGRLQTAIDYLEAHPSPLDGKVDTD